MSGIWEQFLDAAVAGRYRLRALTYDGGDQAEFLAAAPETEDELTVALIRPDPDQTADILSEMRTASRLQHPNILRVLDAGEWVWNEETLLYLACEKADQTLAEAANPLASETVLAVARDVLAALNYLHGQGFAYCNLEPATTVRADGRWKLGDLGRLCPSQERAPRDVWAFGAMFQGLEARAAEPLPPPLAEAIQRCLDPVPERRPAIVELEAMLAPPAVSAPATKAAPRSRRGLIAACLVLLGCCVLALFWTVAKSAAVPTAPVDSKPAQAKAEPDAPILQKPSAMPLRKAESDPAPTEAAAALPATDPPPAPSRTASAAPERPSSRADSPDPDASQPSTVPARASSAEEGIAEYASAEMNGRPTASGERFDSTALTAAHGRYPMGTRLRITNPKNGRSVVVRVNDRGRFRRGHIVRLTPRAARDLGIAGEGAARVKIEVAN